MSKVILTKEQVYELVAENKYKVDPKEKFHSRCIDGRYENRSDLPPLAIPGADAGELGLIVAAGQIYGFAVDLQKTADTLAEVVGGIENIRFHTDTHAASEVAGGCGHVKLITTELETYNTTKEFATFLKSYLQRAKKNGASEGLLKGKHHEGAVLIIKGQYSVLTQYVVETEEGRRATQVFVFHASLMDERHTVLAKKLIENDAVQLFAGCDDEYLSTVLSEVAEVHLFETAKRLAKGLPIYGVNFKDSGEFEVEGLGRVAV